MPAAWISHKGKKILYVDYRKLKPEAILELMRVSDDMVRASPTKVCYLGNIEDAVVTREVVAQLKQYTDKSIRQRFEKLAVVGVTGVKKVFFNALVATLDKSEVQVRSFKTEEEAKEWLAE